MTGEWVMRFQKRRHLSDTDEYTTEGELQMSPIKKRLYDGIYGKLTYHYVGAGY